MGKNQQMSYRNPYHPYRNCDYCNDKFCSQNDYVNHVAVNHTCNFCADSFKLRNELLEHIETVHERLKPEKCPICDIVFGEKALKVHITSVHTNQKAKCDTCEALFSSEDNLKSHIKSVHEEKKSVKCSLCELNFAGTVNLAKHNDFVHEREFLFKCFVCDRFYGSKDGFLTHILKTHHNEKSCKLNQLFNTARGLYKLWKCAFCGINFKTGYQLLKHIESVHEEKKLYNCKVCNQAFSQLFELTEHTALVHECKLLPQAILSNLPVHSFPKATILEAILPKIPPWPEKNEDIVKYLNKSVTVEKKDKAILPNIPVYSFMNGPKATIPEAILPKKPSWPEKNEDIGRYLDKIVTVSLTPEEKKDKVESIQKTITVSLKPEEKKEKVEFMQKTFTVSLVPQKRDKEENIGPKPQNIITNKKKLARNTIVTKKIPILSTQHTRSGRQVAHKKIAEDEFTDFIEEESKIELFDEKPTDIILQTQTLESKPHVKKTNNKEIIKEYPCDFKGCEKLFSEKRNLNRHIQTVHNKIKQFSCPLCKTNFGAKQVMKRHLLKCERKYKKKTKKVTGWKVKKQNTSEDNQIKQKSGNNQIDQVEDKDENNQNDRHECNNCGKQHISECYLDRIKKKSVGNNENFRETGEVACDVCGKPFNHKKNLDRHKKTVHEGLRDFSCPNCKAAFGAKQTAEKHILKCATNSFLLQRGPKFLSIVSDKE